MEKHGKKFIFSICLVKLNIPPFISDTTDMVLEGFSLNEVLSMTLISWYFLNF